MIRAFHYSCEGESHKATNKVCQDYSLTFNEDDLTIAIVCDGHGGERYFRSDIGAKYAAEVSLESVSLFVDQIDEKLLANRPYTAVGPASEIEDAEQLSDADIAFRRLFSSIIYKWNEKIEEHAKANALTDWEEANVPQKYLDEFAAASSFEKFYGCTLMAYVQTSKYWFAFHLGDGKCISFQDNPIWMEPIPWDDRCFLNKTTSLCDTSAIDEFRYCYQGDGSFPVAVFLGSDGMDDSFGEDENLVNFYIQIMKMLVNEGKEVTAQSIETELPQLSAIGSKDDMSVAYVYDEELLKTHIIDLIQYQIKKAEDGIRQMEERIYLLSQKLEKVQEKADSDEKSRIEANYAQQDIIRAKNNLLKLQNRRDSLLSQLAVFNSTQDICNSKKDAEEQCNNT
jgi:hypothetical protein